MKLWVLGFELCLSFPIKTPSGHAPNELTSPFRTENKIIKSKLSISKKKRENIARYGIERKSKEIFGYFAKNLFKRTFVKI